MPPVILPYATSVVANVSEGQTYFYLGLAGNVSGTFSFSFSPEAPHAKTVHVVFQQDNNGSRSVTFASNIYGTPTIGSDGSNLTRVVRYFYEETTASWYAVGTGVS